MQSSWWYKVVSVTVLVLLSIVVLIPTFTAPEECGTHAEAEAAAGRTCLEVPDSWPDWYSWYTDHIYGGRLIKGLDLQGGLHLQYHVAVERAISQKLTTFARDIESRLEEYHVSVDILQDGTGIRVQLPSSEAREALDENLSLYPLELHEEAGGTVRLEMDSDYVDQTRQWAIATAIETIRRRVDSMGVAEPSITQHGQSDIVVELPGLGQERFEQAKRTIGTTAQLEFRGVHPQDRTYWERVAGLIPDDPESTIEYMGGSIESRDLDDLRDFGEWIEVCSRVEPGQSPPRGIQSCGDLNSESPAALPDDAIIVYQELLSFHPRTGEVLEDETRYRMRLVNSRVEMTGETITDVGPATDPNTNRPYVSLTFDSEGADQFCDVTTEYNQKLLAIVLDDVLKSAPIINEPICFGRAQINMGSSGSFDAIYREVENLVAVLRHGALPAPIEPQFERQVGPSLGQESVRSGVTAMLVGSVLVIVFMVFYYRKSGVIANLALILNIVFILAMLTAVQATVTLPGIAGIILTVGMAVDANVIVFERIREELRLGKTPRDAVSAGYSKALWTVLDANITTAIAALVLANYGTGPIRGFAVTLIFGIISSVFTALFVTRLIFDYVLTKNRSQQLSI